MDHHGPSNDVDCHGLAQEILFTAFESCVSRFPTWLWRWGEGVVGWKVGRQVEHVSLLNTHVITNCMIWNHILCIYICRYTQRDQILVTAYSVKTLMRLLLTNIRQLRNSGWLSWKRMWYLHISIPWISSTKSTQNLESPPVYKVARPNWQLPFCQTSNFLDDPPRRLLWTFRVGL